MRDQTKILQRAYDKVLAATDQESFKEANNAFIDAITQSFVKDGSIYDMSTLTERMRETVRIGRNFGVSMAFTEGMLKGML